MAALQKRGRRRFIIKQPGPEAMQTQEASPSSQVHQLQPLLSDYEGSAETNGLDYAASAEKSNLDWQLKEQRNRFKRLVSAQHALACQPPMTQDSDDYDATEIDTQPKALLKANASEVMAQVGPFHVGEDQKQAQFVRLMPGENPNR